MALLLKGATHVDPTTGAREIVQSASDTLSGQIGQLLIGAGFSEADAATASASLKRQFASTSTGADIVGLSLSNRSQSAGTYTASVAGGQEASAFSVQSTTRLDVAFDARSGDLSVNLSEHKIAATRIEWSAAAATNVSIALAQPELDAIGFGPVGVAHSQTNSPVQETVTTTRQGSRFDGVGSANVAGPKALAWYRAFEERATTSLSPVVGLVTPIGAADALSTVAAETLTDRDTADAAVLALRTSSAGSHDASPGLASSTGRLAHLASSPSNSIGTVTPKHAAAEAAVLALKKIVTDARAAFAIQNQPVSRSISVSITQPLGAAVTDQSGNRFLIYSRPSGNAAILDVPSWSAPR